MTVKVALVTGGSTPERQVALSGAGQVLTALRTLGYDVTAIDTVRGVLDPAGEATLHEQVGLEPPTSQELAELAERERPLELVQSDTVREADVVFLVLHGDLGEGGQLQAALDLAGVSYTGSGPLGSAAAMDKDLAKRLFRDAQVPTAPWTTWPADQDTIERLGFPLVIKPSRVGSTVGLSVVDSSAAVEEAVDLALRFDTHVLLESFVPGRELTVGILADRALAVGEIIPSHAIFDYECKYTPGMSEEIFPADIPDELAKTVQEMGLLAHMALNLRDFSRVDFRVGPDGIPMCLEANTLPGLTGLSLLPQSAQAAGVPFVELCDRIVKLALARRPVERNKARING